MPSRTITETMDAIGDILGDLDLIARLAHTRFRSYKPDDLIELDSRAQAACTYAHMVAEADRRFIDKPGIKGIEIRGLKLWVFDDANAVIRLKKMDEDGRTRNYPTRQAKEYDAGQELPGLPMPPVRLTAGYLLDATGTEFVRTQIARPAGRDALWCAAVVPHEDRQAGEQAWRDVTRQMRL